MSFIKATNFIPLLLIVGLVAPGPFANAAPEPATPGVYPATNSAGQSTLPQVSGGSTNQFIDWIVMPYNTSWNTTLSNNSSTTSNTVTDPTTPFAGATSSAYLYLYQVETPSGAGSPHRLSLTLDTSLVLGGGSLAANLDTDLAGSVAALLPGVPGHNATNFPLLGSPSSEFEPTSIKTTGFTFDNDITSGQVGWDYPSFTADTQTAALWFVATGAPAYGLAYVQDGVQWNNDGRGDGVPVPIPEPAAIVLMACGSVVFAIRRRLRASQLKTAASS